METSFFGYIQQLELMAFFSGYPVLYALVNALAGRFRISNNIIPLLPLAYALTGTLYLALQFRNLYPDFSILHLQSSIEQPWWTGWALLALLFWIPLFRKKPILSLFHSLPVFFLLCRDLFFHSVGAQPENNIVRNDMKIYTDSLLLQLGSFGLITLFYFLSKPAKNS